MTGDPFDALRSPDAPVRPDPSFVARLRRQVVAALTTDLPTVEIPTARSTPMTDTSTTPETATNRPLPAARSAITPYLCVAGASAAIDWYRDALGAEVTVRYDGDDGRVGHAELTVGGALLYLADEYPEIGVVAPRTLGGTAVSLHLEVPDVDRTYAAALGGGASGEREPADEAYGQRSATFTDPFGHRWMVQSPIADPTHDEIGAAIPGFTVTSGPAAATDPGAIDPDPAGTAPIELGYFTMSFPDTAAASRFYGALFGWATEGGAMGDGYAHVANTKLPFGFTPGDVDDAAVLYFRVPEVAPYVALVAELGGTVVSEGTYESGAGVECRDDQGRVFQLWQPAPGY